MSEHKLKQDKEKIEASEQKQTSAHPRDRNKNITNTIAHSWKVSRSKCMKTRLMPRGAGPAGCGERFMLTSMIREQQNDMI